MKLFILDDDLDRIDTFKEIFKNHSIKIKRFLIESNLLKCQI